MVSRGFPGIVTGYSHSIDVVVRRALYLHRGVVRIISGALRIFAPKREEMKKLAALTLSMFLVSGTAFADTPKNADSQPTTAAQPAKPKAAKKAASSNGAIATQLEELRQTLQAHHEQRQRLNAELAN